MRDTNSGEGRRKTVNVTILLPQTQGRTRKGSCPCRVDLGQNTQGKTKEGDAEMLKQWQAVAGSQHMPGKVENGCTDRAKQQGRPQEANERNISA